jgi:hypothetical protein
VLPVDHDRTRAPGQRVRDEVVAIVPLTDDRDEEVARLDLTGVMPDMPQEQIGVSVPAEDASAPLEDVA